MCLLIKFKYGYKIINLVYMVKQMLIYNYYWYVIYFNVIYIYNDLFLSKNLFIILLIKKNYNKKKWISKMFISNI